MFKLKKILYPTDFSDSSLAALTYAINFARNYGAKLILMHVVNEKIFSEGLSLARVSAPEALEKEMTAEAGRQLKQIIPAGEREGLDWELVILLRDAVPGDQPLRQGARRRHDRHRHPRPLGDGPHHFREHRGEGRSQGPLPRPLGRNRPRTSVMP